MTLSVTCLLIAAKIEEPIAPSYPAMMQLVEETQKFPLSREVLVALEEAILNTLQFQIRFVNVPFFLERFKRIFDLDKMDSRSV